MAEKSRIWGICCVAACACSTPTALDQPDEPVDTVSEALGTPLSLTDVGPTLTVDSPPSGPYPWAGRTLSASVDPSNDQVALVATDRGGLWRTSDGGDSWTHVDGLPLYAMNSVRYSSRSPNVVIATSWFDIHQGKFSTIWRSTDGGVTWQQLPTAIPPMTAPLTGIKSYGIAFSPDSDHVYVGTAFGLAVSADLGATWTHVDPSAYTAEVLAVDAQPGGIVNIMARCLGTEALCDGTFRMCHGFQRSTDYGVTWTDNPTDPPGTPITDPLGGATLFMGAGDAVESIASSPFDPEVVLALGTRNPTSTTTCERFDVFESDDGGDTWHSLNAPIAGNGRPPFIGVHASGDDVPGHFDIYYGNTVLAYRKRCVGLGPDLRCSEDAADWVQVTRTPHPNPGHTDPCGIAWSATSNCPKFLLTDGGPETSFDCGDSWNVTGNGPTGGLHALQIGDLGGTVHPGSDATDLYIATQDNWAWASTDTAQHWRSADDSPSFVGDAYRVEVVHSLTTLDQTSFGLMPGPKKANRDWSVLEEWVPPPSTNPTASPLAVAKDVWVQFAQPLVDGGAPPPDADNGLFISTTNGMSWNPTPLATVTETLFASPERGRLSTSGSATTLYIPAQRASDGADGLKRVSGITGGTVEVADADVDVCAPGQCAVAKTRLVLSRSIFDGARVWNVDPTNPNHLGAVNSVTSQLVFSDDKGLTWAPNPLGTTTAHGSGKFFFNSQISDGTNVTSGTTSVTAIAFDDTNGSRILLGTEANGILASFDRGASWIQVPGSEYLPSITAFFFDERHSDVYVSTFSRGLWKIGWCGGGGDATAPTFAFVPPDITTASCGTIDIGTARAVDVCGAGGVTITNNRPAKFPPGTTLVTWTARDAAGNVTTATQRVTLLLGDDPACCPNGTNVIVGTSNNNTLNGTAGSDCILSRGAQDTINGLGGNDFISGGDGDDVIVGGSGNDVVFGGSGQDQLTGDLGDDTLFGGDGDDTLRGSAGNDTLRGGQGQDRLFGDDNNDQLFGNDGNDTVTGGNGNDNLVGNDGSADVCTDASGSNTFATCESAPANSCADGVGDGTESDVDCGGGCSRCANGKLCGSSNDCQSGVCVAGSCAPSSGIATSTNGLLQASLQITTEWGSGYCAALTVINNAFVPTVSWSVNVNINAATTYTTWNGTFSGNTGPVTIAPAAAFNQVVPPGASNNSIGFCANRTVPGSGALPSLTAAFGQYF